MTKDTPNEITLRQFAEELRVSYWVAHGWVTTGKVKSRKKGPFPGKTSPILIPVSEVERVKKLMDESQGKGHSNS